jgi:hypothetical protein
MNRRLLETQALHLIARAAVRWQSPLRAKRTVNAVAALLAPLSGQPEAAEILARLWRGTCLTRSLAVAARLPGAEVVIAAGWKAPEGAESAWAHAWVEYRGVPLKDEGEFAGREVARWG